MSTALINPHAMRGSEFQSETKDCTVTALSLLLDVPYAHAHAIMRKVGRGGRKHWADAFLRALPGLSGSHKLARSGSVGKFIAQHPKGRFLVWVRGHAFALIDGQTFDTVETNPACHIFAAYEFPAR